MRLPPEIIAALAPVIENLRETDHRLDELEADIRKIYEHAAGEIPVDTVQQRIATINEAISSTQQTLNIINDDWDDPISIALRELFTRRLKILAETQQYWQTALASLLS